ncbi:MAG: hypothetical protein V3U79_07165 [Dehalococcoidia bacterium]
MKRTVKLLAVVAIVGLLMLAMTATAFAIGPPGGSSPADDTPAADTGHDASCLGQDPHTKPVFGSHSEPGSPNLEFLHTAWHAECDPKENHPNDGS